MAALATELERVTIGGSGSASQPLGILNSPGVQLVTASGSATDGFAPSYSDICNVEYGAAGTGKADRGHLGWLVSPLVRKKLRQTSAAERANVWSETEAYSLLGHPAGVTPGVPDTLTKGASAGICSAILFGEMSELFIGLWGPGVIVSVVTDRNLAAAGFVLVCGTLYCDSGVRSPESFAAMKDALCN